MAKPEIAISNVKIEFGEPPPLQVVVLLVTIMASPVQAGSLSAPCTRPAAPVSVSAEAAVTYRDLITADFETYFAAASSYITSIDEERARAMTDIAAAVADYEAFLNASAPGASP